MRPRVEPLDHRPEAPITQPDILFTLRRLDEGLLGRSVAFREDFENLSFAP